MSPEHIIVPESKRFKKKKKKRWGYVKGTQELTEMAKAGTI